MAPKDGPGAARPPGRQESPGLPAARTGLPLLSAGGGKRMRGGGQRLISRAGFWRGGRADAGPLRRPVPIEQEWRRGAAATAAGGEGGRQTGKATNPGPLLIVLGRLSAQAAVVVV